MSRKTKVYKKHVRPDVIFNNIKVSRFINKVMVGGKKRIAEKIVYDAMKVLGENVKIDQVEAFETAVRNCMPLMEVKSRRVGGSTYQVPIEVKAERALSLGMRWIVKAARSRSGKSMSSQLALELTDAYNKTGTTVKKREDTHKMAEANKAFAHFRW
ncbi:MAG: small subunit ribosomal protein S7 [Candidatus Marinamargulisbacteria bacterium]|jgi:small subunit ribosomal protein S7